MSATAITVTGTYSNADNTAAAGSVTFELNQVIANANTIYHLQPQTVTLDGEGHFSQVLIANDDSGTTPTGSFYTVTEKINDSPETQYTIKVLHSAAGGTVDISTLIPSTSRGVG
jgi:hypothetical protein